MKSTSMTRSSRQVMETHKKTSPGHIFKTHISKFSMVTRSGRWNFKATLGDPDKPRARSLCHGQHEAANSHHGTAMPGENCSRPDLQPLHWFASCMCACLHEWTVLERHVSVLLSCMNSSVIMTKALKNSGQIFVPS